MMLTRNKSETVNLFLRIQKKVQSFLAVILVLPAGVSPELRQPVKKKSGRKSTIVFIPNSFVFRIMSVKASCCSISSLTFIALKSTPSRMASAVGIAQTSGIIPLPFLMRSLLITILKRGRRKRRPVFGNVTSGIIQAVLP